MQNTLPGTSPPRLSESLEDRADKAEQSPTCICGNGKKTMTFFCTECWHALPRQKRIVYGRLLGRRALALWYDEARSYLLEETTRVRR